MMTDVSGHRFFFAHTVTLPRYHNKRCTRQPPKPNRDLHRRQSITKVMFQIWRPSALASSGLVDAETKLRRSGSGRDFSDLHLSDLQVQNSIRRLNPLLKPRWHPPHPVRQRAYSSIDPERR